MGGIGSTESAPSVFRVPPVREYEMRVAFFVDVSASMNTKSCPGDSVDSDVTSCDDDGPSGSVGNDSLFYRLHMIEAWIEQMDQFLAARGLPANKLKMIFIPFSGTFLNTKITFNTPSTGLVKLKEGALDLYLAQKTFTSDRNVIKSIINTYRKMNYAYTLRPPDISSLPTSYGLSPSMPDMAQYRSAAQKYIRTSVPTPALDVMNISIENEIEKIRSAGPDFLSQTRFEVVFMSDGISKPYHDDIRASIDKLWEVRKVFRDYRTNYRAFRDPKSGYHGECASENFVDGCMCGQQYNRGAYCKIYEKDFSPAGLNCREECKEDIDSLLENGVRKKANKNVCIQCIDSILDYIAVATKDDGGSSTPMQSLLDATIANWGDYKLNYYWKIRNSLRGITNTFKNNPELEFRFNFIRFESANSSLKPPAYLLTKERNWMTLAKEMFSSQHRHAASSSGALPFALFPNSSSVNGYKLSHFFVLNPQVRLNPFGFAVVDSDADGLFDHEEDQLSQYDKNKSRTNGICLDVIDFRYGGCVTLGCDPEIDIDGDGLNQCEELTLGTSDIDWDFDNDGISDYFEVIYGFNPLVDDRAEDYNGDGISNFINFTHGAGPWTDIASVPDERKIRLEIRESTPIERTLSDGSVALVPAYTFKLLGVPNMASLFANGGNPTYYNIHKNPKYLNTPPILPVTFGENRTRLLLLGRVDHTQNYGDVFWIYQVIDTAYSLENMRIEINLDDMIPMPWKDPVGGTL